MGLVTGMWVVLLGVTAVASFVFRKWEKGRRLALCFVQLGVGGQAVLWGWTSTMSLVASLEWASRSPVYWLTFAARGLVELTLGLALLAGMALTLMTGPQEAPPRSALRKKLAVAQLVMGVLTIGLGTWTVVYGFLFFVG